MDNLSFTERASAGYEDEIEHILGKADLEKKYFDIIVGVDTIKKTKPSPDVFRHALCKLNVKPDEALFVGDHIDMDYNGARAAGIRALLIEREDRTANDIHDPDRIRSLEEIFKFIDQARAGELYICKTAKDIN